VLWEQLRNQIEKEHKEITGEWRYYNDGKCWFCRGLKKEKVIFWIAVMGGSFSVTFYLSSKAEPFVKASDLPVKHIEQFESTKNIKFRYISVAMESQQDIDTVLKLVKIKLKLK